MCGVDNSGVYVYYLNGIVSVCMEGKGRERRGGEGEENVGEKQGTRGMEGKG